MSVSYSMIDRIFRKRYKGVVAGDTLVVNRTHVYTGGAGNVTLPSSANLGDTITIVGDGSGVFTIAQNAGQTIRHLTSDTTAGTGGSLAAGTVRDAIVLVCTGAGASTEWTSVVVKGTFTVA